jgi:hypothetical protein
MMHSEDTLDPFREADYITNVCYLTEFMVPVDAPFDLIARVNYIGKL